MQTPPRQLAAATVGAALLYTFVLRPRHLRWGATATEASAPMLGDDAVQHAMLQATRAVQINAPPEAVWPWLVQMGACRAGYYSVDWLERVSGMDIRNADTIHPEWQNLQVGDTMPLGPNAAFEVVALEPPRQMVLLVRGPGFAVSVSFELQVAGANQTRLLDRLRARSSLAGWRLLYWLLFEPGDFVMTWQMLRGIRARAERSWTQQCGASHVHRSDPSLSLAHRARRWLEYTLDWRLRSPGILLYRLTRGGLARPWGIDVLLLTTRGRRTGKPRTVVLPYLKTGADLVVVAANAGRTRNPDWFLNLESDPTARIEIDGHTQDVHEVVMTAEEAAAFWPHILEQLPGYARYRQYTTRAIPLVRLQLSPARATRPAYSLTNR